MATLSAAVLSACFPSAGAAGAGNAPERSRDAATSRAPQRPKTKKVTVMLEGSPEPMTLTRFDAARDRFPLPFSTYVPPDIAVETASSGEGEAVRFVASFGGKRNRDVYLQVAYARHAATERQALGLARGIAESRGLRRRAAGEPRRFPWSRAEYDFLRPAKGGAPRQAGTVAVGRHAGRYFYMILNYPVDYEAGFAPRAERILTEWRWRDTGMALARE